MSGDNKFQWWNPLGWVDMMLQMVGAVLRSILQLFGMLAPPRTDGHQNIQVTDVEVEKKTAEEQQAAIDHLQNEMTPAQIVRAYCRATEDERRLMNLEKLSVEQQDWLMRLSDAQLVMLGESGEAACGRSVEARQVKVTKAKLRAPEVEVVPVVLPIPQNMAMTEEQKEEIIRDRFNELRYSLSAANSNPKFTPRDRPTVH